MTMNPKTIASYGGLFGGVWAIALVAANLTMAPHKVEARERVKFMCAWAKSMETRQARTDQNAYRACVGSAGIAVCVPPEKPEPNPLLDECIRR